MIKNMFFLTLCLSIFLMQGCAWLGKKDTAALDRSRIVDSSQAFNKALLKKGGNIAIVPFIAGPDVEATEELDNISLMVVKGIAETIRETNSLLTVSGPRADKSRFIVKGTITKLSEPGKLNKLILRKKKKQFAVAGKVIERKTKKVALYFSKEIMVKDNKINYRTLGEQIGRDVGQFIVSNVN